jgi:uncharacterized membrane protein YjjP (DUF1212 family)
VNNKTVSTPVYEDELDLIFSTALDVGENLLKNGAAVHRAEDTIERICRAFGATHVEVFCIPSLIIASVRMGDGDYCSQTRRIYSSANNFYRLDRLNSVSRRLCSGALTLHEAQEEIRTIKKQDAYPSWMLHIAAILSCGGFSVFFGGTFLDALAAAVIACIISLLKSRLPRSVNVLSYTLVSSLLAGILAILLHKAGIADNYDKVMIGTIMYVIPGLALGTALRDLLSDDTLSGVLRLFRSLLIAVTIALGYTAGIYLYGEGQAFSYELNNLPMMLLMSLVGPLGVALMYRVRPRHIPLILVGSELSFVVYYLFTLLFEGQFFPNLLATVAVGLFARMCAKLGKFPAVVISVPAIMPLLPGGILYYTMHSLMFGLGEEALVCASRTISIALGIAAGEVAVSLIYMAIRSAQEKIKERI